jgi:hypothetical protein
VPADRLIAFARQTYSSKWSRRIAEDLVEVLNGLGASPGTAVDLLLADLGTGRAVERRAVPMTREKRERVKASWDPRRVVGQPAPRRW